MAIASNDNLETCFGSTGYGSEGCTTGEKIKDASTSFWGGCAIKDSDSSIWCWGPTTVYGTNSRPTLSECERMSNSCTAVTATLTPPSGAFKTIACGGKRAGHFCCAVKSDDSMHCFGAGTSDYTPPSSSWPTQALHQLSCGTDFCCGLTPTTGNLICFGNLNQADYDGGFTFENPQSWLGNGEAGTDIPSSMDGPFVQVSCGNFGAYTLAPDSSVKAYGRVFKSSVGPVEAFTSVKDLPFSSGWTALGVNAGFGHGCASIYSTANSDKAACWGADYGDQVSNAASSVLDDASAYFFPSRIGTVT